MKSCATKIMNSTHVAAKAWHLPKNIDFGLKIYSIRNEVPVYGILVSRCHVTCTMRSRLVHAWFTLIHFCKRVLHSTSTAPCAPIIININYEKTSYQSPLTNRKFPLHLIRCGCINETIYEVTGISIAHVVPDSDSVAH